MKYNGSVSNYITWQSKLLLYSGSLTHGELLTSPNFQATTIPDDLTNRIRALETSTNSFQPLNVATDEEKEAHERKHDREVNELNTKYKNLEQVTRKINEQVISATKIITHAGLTTEGMAKTSIDTVINNASMNVQVKPVKLIQICRTNHYPPGSATTAADVIKHETDLLPRATTLEEIRENVQAITRANSFITTIGEDLDRYYLPRLEEVDKVITQKR